MTKDTRQGRAPSGKEIGVSMSQRYQVLLNNLETFIFLKREVNFILEEYEMEIKIKMGEILNQTYEESIETIKSLFEVQDKISVVKYKFNYDISEFLDGFIYDFDRQDDESICYLINKIKKDFRSN